MAEKKYSGPKPTGFFTRGGKRIPIFAPGENPMSQGTVTVDGQRVSMAELDALRKKYGGGWSNEALLKRKAMEPIWAKQEAQQKREKAAYDALPKEDKPDFWEAKFGHSRFVRGARADAQVRRWAEKLKAQGFTFVKDAKHFSEDPSGDVGATGYWKHKKHNIIARTDMSWGVARHQNSASLHFERKKKRG